MPGVRRWAADCALTGGDVGSGDALGADRGVVVWLGGGVERGSEPSGSGYEQRFLSSKLSCRKGSVVLLVGPIVLLCDRIALSPLL